MVTDKPRINDRSRSLSKLQRYLLERGTPRFHMFLIVFATGVSALLISFGLLHGGLHTMWLRYATSLVLAYLIFLVLIKLWAGSHGLSGGVHRPARSSVEVDPLDVLDAAESAVDCVRGADPTLHVPPAGASTPCVVDEPLSGKSTGGWLEIDSDELFLLIAVLAAASAIFIGTIYVVWSAPSLMAEVLLDTLIGAGLYRSIRNADHRGWLEAAVSRTWLPMLAIIVSVALAGAAMQSYAPEASSIRSVLQHFAKLHHTGS